MKCQLRPSRRAKRPHPESQDRSHRQLTPQTQSTEGRHHAPEIEVDIVQDDVIEVIAPQLRALHSDTPSRHDSRDRTTFQVRTRKRTSSTNMHAPGVLEEHDTSPSQLSHQTYVSRSDLVAEATHRSDIDTGFLQVFGPEQDLVAQEQTLEDALQQQHVLEPQPHDLTESFAETYWEYCYCWCPVLDPQSLYVEVSRSPLLANALASAASHIQPPLIPHLGPAKYYAKARAAFYDDEEPDPVTTLKAIALFYWWAPRAPTTVHRHSSWWWSSVLIRHAQQMNLHREPTTQHPLRTEYMLSVRRRIWWTAFVSSFLSLFPDCRSVSLSFCGWLPILLKSRPIANCFLDLAQQARERLTALCQSKPAIIDPDDCNVREPSLLDFPSDPRSQRKGEIFIHWVRLCAIIGRVAKTLHSPGCKNKPSVTAEDHLKELSNWIKSLPSHLQLPIQNSRTSHFDKDVHQLHLPYLTTIIILHLKRVENPLPQALPPAILAASCIARILKDILARGNFRFLMAITCWYTGTAFIPLLQASHFPHISKEANECLDILERTAEHLRTMWASANVIHMGFQRLRRGAITTSERSGMQDSISTRQQPEQNGEAQKLASLPNVPSNTDNDRQDSIDNVDWMVLFPFITRQTSSIADSLLTGRGHGAMTRAFPYPEHAFFHEALMTQFDDLFTMDALDVLPPF